MDTFTATNGFKVRVIAEPGSPYGIYLDHAERMDEAVKEYLEHCRSAWRAEEDERLGRWRWPENTDWVVFRSVIDPARRNTRGVTVLNETIPRIYTVWEDRVETFYGTSVDEDARREARNAARAYFDAHPEPKPWHKAKEGEVWELTFSDEGGGGTEPWIVADGFRNPRYVTSVRLTDPTITAGRRIYPDEVSS